MRCAFVIQSKSVSARSTVPALTNKGARLGYAENEASDYTRDALDCLKIGRPDLRRLKDELGSTVQSKVTALVKQCMA